MGNETKGSITLAIGGGTDLDPDRQELQPDDGSPHGQRRGHEWKPFLICKLSLKRKVYQKLYLRRRTAFVV